MLGGVNSKMLTTFTRQLAILQEAGLPILRSLKILEQQAKPGALKNSLIDVCDEIESGSTLSEAMGKSPKAFNRLYVNMIKAGEAGGALEIILKRLAEFQERAQSLKRKVRGAMIYPIFVVLFAVSILVFIMLKIVPQFEKIFKDFNTKLPDITLMLINIANWVGNWWFLIPAIPIGYWLYVKLLRKFAPGRMGWDFFALKAPIFGQIGGEEHRRPHACGRWARWWPAACRSWRPCTSRGRRPAMRPSRRCSARSTTRSARANRSPSP